MAMLILKSTKSKSQHRLSSSIIYLEANEYMASLGIPPAITPANVRSMDKMIDVRATIFLYVPKPKNQVWLYSGSIGGVYDSSNTIGRGCESAWSPVVWWIWYPLSNNYSSFQLLPPGLGIHFSDDGVRIDGGSS